jgi:hypothetical protein
MQTGSGTTISLTPWWGTFALPLGKVLHFRVGPCALWVERLAREVRVMHVQHQDPLDTTLGVASADPVPDGALEARRYAVPEAVQAIELSPGLADRPVVVRTSEPFHVLAGHDARLYLTTPAWIRIAAAEPRREMIEQPCYRPSDTWFGPSTREGQLCYAGTTTARLSLNELSLRPGRAVTCVHIINESKSLLALDRISIPAPALSVFAARDHRLWTEPLEVRREPDGEIRGLTIGRGAPEQAEGAVRLSAPRQSDDPSLFARAFKALLG